MRSHVLVHTSQHWEVQLIARLFIKNQFLFTIASGISNLGLEQLTSATHFDEQNKEGQEFTPPSIATLPCAQVKQGFLSIT